MSKDGTIGLKRFKRVLSLRILVSFIATLILYTAVVIGLYFMAWVICNTLVWQGDNPLYILLSSINNNIDVFLIGVCGTGYVVIFLYYWARTLGYLEKVVDATENIYRSDHEPVQLPPALREVENRMNGIKLDVRENERRAREADQRKNDLVVYLAHDLKTPLTSVIGYLALLRDEGQISEELRERYLSIALDKAERLEDLINEFFDITRFSLSSLALELKRVNLTLMLQQLVAEFAPLLREKQLRCTLDAPPDVMLICDPDKLQRVFDNLLRNAINYSFDGSEIMILLKAPGDAVKLSFINRGPTIPAHKLEKIFEQFYRLDSARSSKTGEAGLGLAIAREIVELHQGSITAYSADEVIAFELTLPGGR